MPVPLSATFMELAIPLKARVFELIDLLKSTAHENLALHRWGLRILCTAGILYICRKIYSKAISNHCNSEKGNWSHEVVLITGGCSGIGERIARKFEERRVKVVVLDIMPPKTAMSPYIHFYKCDITSPEEIHRTAQLIREDVGYPTILINNAGVGTAKDMLDETDEEIKRTFHVNNLAHFWILREYLPHIIQMNHGHIVTVASMASFLTIASNISYSCTKAAALSLHEGLTQELRHRYMAEKVRTSIIHPTWVRTPLIGKQVESGQWKSRTIEADSVADAVVSHILRWESGQLFLPATYSVVSLLRSFPSWLQESVRNSQSEVLRVDN
ncbi:hypothetical protein BDV38DRAFT_272674 [Aspergillus pseudotamarii]|uniref:Short-chain dehydrogenase/reductase 3 n=1 Tax=Aspergillus pseudotamarii TaxID=132259 RepID=A0A5N6SM66_ASPPS|nr:uncharacterized protein BDV38DRAFT_272674 [Aspergillus pseudotamarii]KAE8135655.1 hypothetical protein BDV38DRAFT_272674 [Aspergillus pseudotamarii]